jgi:GntR family transcriptional regulator/MocR family aminotransferase
MNQFITIHGIGRAFMLAARVAVKVGECVAMTSPNDWAANTFRFLGSQPLFTGSDQNGMLMDQLELLCQTRKDIKAVFVRPAADNPTGVTLSEERREQLLALSAKYHFIILEMDDDHEFWHTPKLIPLVSREHDGRVVYISSISRTVHRLHALGLIAGPEAFIKAVDEEITELFLENYRDLPTEQIVVHLVEENTIQTLAAHAFSAYGKIMEEAPLYLNNYFRELGTFAIPNAGLSVWLQLHNAVDLTSHLGVLEKRGLRASIGSHADKIKAVKISLGDGIQTLEPGFKIIRDSAGIKS